MTDFRDVLRSISGPLKPDALMRVARFLTAGQVDVAEGELEPGLVQLADGTIWLVNPDGSLTQVTGGGSPGAARVLGPFPFAFDTPDIENGVAFYTPTIGDILLDAWIEVDTAFDGTTPMADIGDFSNDSGWFAGDNYPVDIAVPDDFSAFDYGGSTLLSQGVASPSHASSLSLMQVQAPGSFTYLQRGVPGKFAAANPIKVVVSQDGKKGGTAVGGTAGAGAVYLVVATPSLT